MKIFRSWGLTLFLILMGGFWLPSVTAATCDSADCGSVDECQRKQNECNEIQNIYESANNKNKEQLEGLQKRLAELKQSLVRAGKELMGVEEEIKGEEEDLAYQQKLFNSRVRDEYKKSRQFSLLLTLLAADNAAQLTRQLSYRQAAAGEDKKIINEISGALTTLKENQEKLVKNKAWLAKTQKEVDAAAVFLDKEVAKAEAYLGVIEGKIAQLSAKQKALLEARSGTFTTSVGEVPISNFPCAGPPGAPNYCDPGGGTWFATFSFGAWTHRKGMSQYGAKGRAEAGQSANEILQAYYGRQPAGKDTGGTISVSGVGNIDFENNYLMGIAEMPSSWHAEALKAQAIAARSYAYRYKAEGKAICTTQACQVFSSSKAANPPAAWRAAVEATRGQVIEGVTTFYSSTSGGYLTTSGWDTTDGQGGAGFASRAWESKAGSPWFYASWYTQSYSSGSAACGRSHPWLNSEEMADILNAWLVLEREGNDERILPETINQCSVGGTTGNPYNKEELRQKAAGFDGGYSAVTGVSVVYSQNGETASLTFQTNRGPVEVSGSKFKQAFNLRAPGYIAIRSPLFNVEQK